MQIEVKLTQADYFAFAAQVYGMTSSRRIKAIHLLVGALIGVFLAVVLPAMGVRLHPPAPSSPLPSKLKRPAD